MCFNLNAPSEADAVKRSEGMQTMQTKEHFSTWIHEKPAVMRRYEAVMALTVFFCSESLTKVMSSRQSHFLVFVLQTFFDSGC